MIVVIQPSIISGNIQAPASKSAMQRALAAALIHKVRTIIRNPGISNDDKAALKVIQQLGAKIIEDDKKLIIDSEGISPVTHELNFGESGLGVRMFTSLAALSNKPITLTGEGSLLSRPMNFFDEVLPGLGIEITSTEGKLPLTIKGPLQPKNIEINGSLSSQFLTGLLFAYSAADASDVSIKVKDLKSKPYIDLTLQLMNDFGLKVPSNNNYKSFYFETGTNIHHPSTINYTIEGDWSGAAFLFVAAAITGNVKVAGLKIDSMQADKAIIDALSLAGANVLITDEYIEVKKKELHSFEFDATDCPDLFPPLVALAANCKGISKIRGLQRLKHKESDRGVTLQQEFEKFSTRIELNEDVMLIHGESRIIVKESILNSHNDHRIAMACAVAGLNADAEVQISNADAVKKSYPDFWDHLKTLNAGISLKPFTTDNTFRF